MAAIRNSVYFLRLKNEDDPKVTHHLEVIDRELSRSDEVIERLLQMTKEESIKIESVDLEELAKEALMYTDTSNSSDFRFRYEPDAFEVKVDRILFRQVLSNLFLNSIQASNGSPGRCPLGVIAQKKEVLPCKSECGIVEAESPANTGKEYSNPFIPTKWMASGWDFHCARIFWSGTKERFLLKNLIRGHGIPHRITKLTYYTKEQA